MVEAIERVFAGTRAEDALADLLRAHPRWQNDERALAANRVFGVALWQRRLDFAARLDPASRTIAAERLCAFVLDAERAALALASEDSCLSMQAASEIARSLAAPPAWPADPVARLAVERSLPTWLATSWCEELGHERADSLALAMNQKAPITVRANRAKLDREALARVLADEGIASHPTRFARDGLCLVGRPNIFGSKAWRAGLFEVQDEGSQLVAAAAGPRPGERCVDFCAGAGGKTLALAADLVGDRQSEVIALVVGEPRRLDLRARWSRAFRAHIDAPLAREPLPSLTLVAIDDEHDPRIEPFFDGADVVLVDAPCTSLGTLRRSPDLRWRLDPRAFPRVEETQRSILRAAARLVRPGGRLVYATCTLRRAECEDVAREFEARGGFAPLPLEDAWGHSRARAIGATGHTARLTPDVHGTDGFFVAAWSRSN